MEIEWRAFELRPAEVRAFDEAAMEEKKKQIAAFWPRVKQIARERYGLDIEQGPWGIDSGGPMTCTRVAAGGRAGVRCLFRCFEASR